MAVNPSAFQASTSIGNPAIAVSGTPAAGSGLVATSGTAAGWTPVATRQATTPAAGTALINGTATLASWTTPNDAQPHNFRISAIQTVTVAETGGQVQVAFTDSAGNAATSVLFAGGSGTGDAGISLDRLAAPNTAVQVNQSTALTAGAATVWAQIWGV